MCISLGSAIGLSGSLMGLVIRLKGISLGPVAGPSLVLLGPKRSTP